MKYISFCSGIEAASQAWESLGWEPVAFCEIDKFPSRVLAHHYPSVPNLGDFTKVDWLQWSADICVGGTPCQAFSVAGLRKSLSDERGNLSLEFIRAVNIIRPRFVVWENVPGVLSTPDNAFGCFLAGLVGCEEPIVFEQGWPNAGVVDGPIRRCAWRVLDAQYFGLAQRRRRVFVVASSGDGPHPAEILFEWEGLRRDSPPSREAGKGTARGIEIGPSGGGFTDVNPTLDSRCKDGPIRNQLAGAVAMCLNTHGGGGRLDAESETSIAHSLRADGFDASEDGTGRGTPLVPVEVPPPIGFMWQGGHGCSFDSDHMGTLIKNQTPAVAIQAGALRENPDSGPDGVGVQEHIAYTLEARAEVQAVATLAIRGRGDDSNFEFRTDGTANALLTPNGGRAGIGVGAIQSGMAVRRLTPAECEKLQGFPPNYTAIPGAADGPRYKALGNSMAVPCMAWIGRRIQKLS
jgi:DNA (cytosine-5)-methyltransferase 1